MWHRYIDVQHVKIASGADDPTTCELKLYVQRNYQIFLVKQGTNPNPNPNPNPLQAKEEAKAKIKEAEARGRTYVEDDDDETSQSQEGSDMLVLTLCVMDLLAKVCMCRGVNVPCLRMCACVVV